MGIAILGDVHFRADKPYFRAISESILDFYDNWELNNKDNALILLGDLVESSINGGIVIDYLERLWNTTRFHDVYICVGNHDLKKVNGIEQLAYEFYSRKSSFHIYKDIEVVNIEGQRVLILPYYVGLKNGKTMKDFYSHLSEDENFGKPYDLIVGHFADETTPFGGSDVIDNLDKLDGKVVLGHVHTRASNPKRYIGSVYAEKKTENDPTRCALFFEGNRWEEYTLPIFAEHVQVTYPNNLPKSKAIVPIYTILECANEALAREKYGDIYIKKVLLESVDSTNKTSREIIDSFNSVKNASVEELWEKFKTSEQSKKIDRNVMVWCDRAMRV